MKIRPRQVGLLQYWERGAEAGLRKKGIRQWQVGRGRAFSGAHSRGKQHLRRSLGMGGPGRVLTEARRALSVCAVCGARAAQRALSLCAERGARAARRSCRPRRCRCCTAAPGMCEPPGRRELSQCGAGCGALRWLRQWRRRCQTSTQAAGRSCRCLRRQACRPREQTAGLQHSRP